MKKSHSAETMLYLFIECAAVRRRAYQLVHSHSKLKTQEDAVKDQTWPVYLPKSAFVSAAVKLLVSATQYTFTLYGSTANVARSVP